MTSAMPAQELQSIPRIAPPEPDLDPEELIRRAESMCDMLRSRQDATEAEGNISVETNQALVDAGFYRVVQPKAFGGYGFDLPTYVRMIAAISRGCPETAWVLSLTLGHVYQLSTYPLAAQLDAYGHVGDFRAPEVAARQGVGVAVPGGYRVSGAWDYASGSEHGTHILLVFAVDEPHPNVDSVRMGLFDRRDYEIVRNWNTIGMQGTGSDRVTLDDIFVPEHRTKPYPGAMEMRHTLLPPAFYEDSPLFHGPFRPFTIAESASVVIGAAEGALDLYEEGFRVRRPAGPIKVSRYELSEYQLNFGKCRALVDTARAALLQASADFMKVADEIQATNEPCSDEVERRITLVLLQGIELAHQAADIIFRTAGSSAARKDSMLGRYWRNICVMRGHVAHQLDSAAINFGRTHFGVPPVGIA